MLYLILSFIIVILTVFLFTLNREIAKLKAKIKGLDNGFKNLSIIGKGFPEYIKRGEGITKNLAGDLKIKENALRKLIEEAQKCTGYLEYMEGKVENQQKTLNKEMIGKILILVNQGFNLEEISESLNLPIGEVELIVNLRKFSDTGEEDVL